MAVWHKHGHQRLTLADKTDMPGRAVMSRAIPRRALQAARAGAAPRSPSVGSPLPFLAGGRTVADVVLGTGVAPQPCTPPMCGPHSNTTNIKFHGMDWQIL